MFLPIQPASAQDNGEAKVSGKVISRFSLSGEEVEGSENSTGLSLEIPVSDAKVTITAGKQSFKLKTGTTGNFSCRGLPSGNVHLSIEKEGFEEFSEDVVLTHGDNVIIVELKQGIETLNPAVKTEDVPLVSMRGDTLVFNTAAIPLQESDYAIDLLRQFPGVEVKDGQIAVFGKSVSRTYVNGALIFGSSPMAAMENIKGSEILTMDVYDEAGVMERKDGIEREKDRVINVKTRNPILSATDVRAIAYAGVDGKEEKGESLQARYSLGASGKFFSETFQLTGEVVGSNMGMTSTSSRLPFVMTNYQESKNASFSMEKHFKDALMGDALRLSYTYGDSWSKRESKKETEYFAAGDIPGRNVYSSSLSRSKQSSHNFNVDAKIWTNPKFELSLSSFLSFSDSHSRIDHSEKTVIQQLSMSQSPLDNSEDQSWRVGGNLSFTPISRKKRLFTVDASYLREENRFPSFQLDTLSSSYVKRHLVKEGEGKTENISLSIGKYLFQKSSENGSIGLRASYEWSHSRNGKDQLSYNLFPMWTDDPTGTYDYTYKVTGNKAGLDLYFSKGTKSRGSLSIAAAAHNLSDLERVPESQTRKTYFSLLPGASISFSSLRFFTYTSSVQIPLVDQIRGRIENGNPLHLVAGNPSIKRSFSHNFTMQERFSFKSRFMLSASIGITTDPIVPKVLFFPTSTILREYGNYQAPAGAYLSTYENADYSLNAQILLNMFQSDMKLFGRIFTMTMYPQLSFSSTPQYYSETLDHNFLLGPSFRSSFTYTPSSLLRITGSTEASYGHNWNGLGTFKVDQIHVDVNLDARGDFLKRGYYEASYLWNGLFILKQPDYNRNINRLNLAVGIAVGKEKALRIGLHGVNLLDSGSDYVTSLTGSSLSRTWNPVPGRSFLLSFTYRFNNTAKRPLPTITF
ncbi:MAG: carboxypeptidase regulatory-like domain-containing protein [Bacteroidales bacterium]|nr:carboxypeptidase regulatory-like domain-containing protein [Bacteroidales bacterium]